MKQFFTALLFLFCTAPIAGQSGTDSTQVIFCKVTELPRASNSPRINIDMGTASVFPGLNFPYLLEKGTNHPIKFTSAIDALNLLSAHGWQLGDSGLASLEGGTVLYYYLMQLKVRKDNGGQYHIAQ